jgi:hypothetical protein
MSILSGITVYVKTFIPSHIAHVELTERGADHCSINGTNTHDQYLLDRHFKELVQS